MIHTPQQMKSEVRDKMRGGPGSVSIQHLFQKEEFGGKVRLCARLTLPPGAGIGLHSHETEDEVFIVTHGRGLVDEGTGERPVKAGDAILTGRGGSHSVLNDGTEDLEMIAIIVSY